MIFENIEEIINNIIELLKEKESFELKIEKQKELKLILKPLIGRKIKNIEFLLTKKEVNKDNLINTLIDKINSLEKENQFLKNKFSEFEELFKEEIKEKKLDRKIKEYLIGDSITTINKYKEYELIKIGLYNQVEELKDKLIKLKLIFKSSRDGWTAKDFHQFCDDKCSTISIIKTKDNNLFGGYLNIKWKSEGGSTYDKKSFLFSFNKNKIYPTTGEYACTFEKDRGPYFSHAINIFNDFKASKKHYVRTKGDMTYCWKNVFYDYELNDYREYFDIEEIEVFQVLSE